MKGAPSEPECTTKAGVQRLSLLCKIENTINVEKKHRRGVLEKMAHKTMSNKPVIAARHTSGTARQNCSNNSKIQKQQRLPSSHLAQQRETVHTLLFPFPNHVLISSPCRQSLLAASEFTPTLHQPCANPDDRILRTPLGYGFTCFFSVCHPSAWIKPFTHVLHLLIPYLRLWLPSRKMRTAQSSC